MRRSVLLFLVILLPLLGRAQTLPDRFENYDDMLGKKVVMYDLSQAFQSIGPFVYSLVNGKYKVVKDDSIYRELGGNLLTVDGITQEKKKSFIKVYSDRNQYFLLLNNKVDFLSLTRSVTYWEQKKKEFSGQYNYVKYPSPLTRNVSYKSAAKYMDRYVPITWTSIQMPDNIDGDVLFDCIIGDRSESFTESIIQDNCDDFVSYSDYSSQKQAYEDSLAEVKRVQELEYSHLDSTLVCEAMILHNEDIIKKLKDKDITYSEEDTLWFSIYGCHKETSGYGSYKRSELVYDGYVMTEPLSIASKDLKFMSDSESSYARHHIEFRENGYAGLQVRKDVAFKNDSIRSRYQLNKSLERLERLNDVLDKLDKFRQQKKILILEQTYSYSSYKFGLKFKFFNCYSKDIKYIVLRIVAFNQVGDVQRDDIGNFAKDVRCIGPLEVKEEGVYDFDELFWDDNDIIHHLDVVEVKVTFMDNTTVTYSGKDKVNLHRSSYYLEEQRKIIEDSGILTNSGS